ncbi:MAG: glycerate kinase [Rhodospirillales bacterium]
MSGAPNPQQALLRCMFDAAVEAAMPRTCVPPFLPDPTGINRLVVVGAGKASAAMARAVEDNWSGPLEGLVVTRYGYEVDCDRIEIVTAAHPVPDDAGEQAAKRILDIARSLGPDDVMLCLVSGGGSALLAAPAEGLTLADKQEVNRALLKSGANIGEMNCVRKHLSLIKGGRLAAAAHPARVISLLISDVPGDDPSVIASGPTVPDETTYADARAILEKYGIEPSAAVRKVLTEEPDETPKADDPRLAGAETKLVALPQASLEAAARVAAEAGYTPHILGDALEGEARVLGAEHAALAERAKTGKGDIAGKVAIISGGETTVVVRGNGRGGRNSEYALAMAIALDGAEGIHAIACDTDGVDGSEENAGAEIGPQTLANGRDAGVDASAHLDANDAYSFFEKAGGLVVTGPTFTNVNDFRAIIVDS